MGDARHLLKTAPSWECGAAPAISSAPLAPPLAQLYLRRPFFFLYSFPLMTLTSRLRFLWLTLAVVFLDRATKTWIESRPADRFPEPVIPNFFYLVESRNPAIAFRFFAGRSSPALPVILIPASPSITPL